VARRRGCGLRPRQGAGEAAGERDPTTEVSLGGDRAALERATGCQAANGGWIDVVGARDVGLGFALPEALQCLVTLMRILYAWDRELRNR
jgi:hypothetical protein